MSAKRAPARRVNRRQDLKGCRASRLLSEYHARYFNSLSNTENNNFQLKFQDSTKKKGECFVVAHALLTTTGHAAPHPQTSTKDGAENEKQESTARSGRDHLSSS